jgi:hypothetical protein
MCLHSGAQATAIVRGMPPGSARAEKRVPLNDDRGHDDRHGPDVKRAVAHALRSASSVQRQAVLPLCAIDVPPPSAIGFVLALVTSGSQMFEAR